MLRSMTLNGDKFMNLNEIKGLKSYKPVVKSDQEEDLYIYLY